MNRFAPRVSLRIRNSKFDIFHVENISRNNLTAGGSCSSSSSPEKIVNYAASISSRKFSSTSKPTSPNFPHSSSNTSDSKSRFFSTQSTIFTLDDVLGSEPNMGDNIVNAFGRNSTVKGFNETTEAFSSESSNFVENSFVTNGFEQDSTKFNNTTESPDPNSSSKLSASSDTTTASTESAAPGYEYFRGGTSSSPQESSGGSSYSSESESNGTKIQNNDTNSMSSSSTSTDDLVVLNEVSTRKKDFPDAKRRLLCDTSKVDIDSILKLVEQYQKYPIEPVTMHQLASHNSENANNFVTAAFLKRELSVRLAHRIHDFRELPFIVLTNPHFYKVYQLYLDSFYQIAGCRIPEEYGGELAFSGSDEWRPFAPDNGVVFTEELLTVLMDEHKNVIGNLQKAYQSFRHIDLTTFLNKVFITRIGNRVLAESFKTKSSIVSPQCSPVKVVKHLGPALTEICRRAYPNIDFALPRIEVKGDLALQFSFIPEHLQFILQEILKNAMRATIEYTQRYNEANIGAPRSATRCKANRPIIKVSDRGGGIHPLHKQDVWRFGYTTAENELKQFDGLSKKNIEALKSTRKQVAGYGFGLPLSKLYARYFGGSIHFQTMYGYGTDVYINLNHLGNVKEGLDLSSIEDSYDRRVF